MQFLENGAARTDVLWYVGFSAKVLLPRVDFRKRVFQLSVVKILYSFWGLHFRTWMWFLSPLRFLLKIKFGPEHFSAQHLAELTSGKDTILVLPYFFFLDAFILNCALRQLGFKPAKYQAKPNLFKKSALLGIRSRRSLFLSRDDRDAFTSNLEDILKRDARVAEGRVALLPVSVFWSRKTERFEQNFLMKALFHDDGNSHALQRFLVALLQGGVVRIHFGKPLTLRKPGVENTAEKGDMANLRFSPERILAKSIRRDLLIEFNREKSAVLGPNLYDFQSVGNYILGSPEVQNFMEKHEKDKLKAEKKLLGFLNEIAANYNFSIIRAFEKVLDFIWTVIFKGVRVRNFENVSAVARSGQILWMPCHRSHLDYMLLSYVLCKNGLVTPHIAAGQNLSFFPVGALLRRGGAFFMRRSFQGNKLYSFVFGQYVNFLMHNSFPVEFFHEGGRSRIGKLLSPKLGFTSICVSSIIHRKAKNTYIVPVYFGYDKVMEDEAYASELSGAKKQKESFWILLKSIRYLFGNYGYADVAFGEPIHFGTFWHEYFSSAQIKALGTPTTIKPDLDACSFDLDARDIGVQNFVKALAKRVNQGINQAATASTSSLIASVLCSWSEPQIQKTQLLTWISKSADVVELLSKLLGWNVAVSAATQKGTVIFQSEKARTTGEDTKVVGISPDIDSDRLETEEDSERQRLSRRALSEAIVQDAQQWEFIEQSPHDPNSWEKSGQKEIRLWWYRGTIFHLLAVPSIVACLLFDADTLYPNRALLERKLASIRLLWEEELFWPESTSTGTILQCGLLILQKFGVVSGVGADQIFVSEEPAAIEAAGRIRGWTAPERELYGLQLSTALHLLESSGKIKRDDLLIQTVVAHKSAFLRGKAQVPPNLSKVFGSRTFDALFRAGLLIPHENQNLHISFSELVGVSAFLGLKYWQSLWAAQTSDAPL